mgnify:CR=1 FL=1
METSSAPRRIHPLVAAAAASVILVSLTGIAAMTGLLPTSHGNAPAPVAATAPTEPAPQLAALDQPAAPPAKAETPKAEAPAKAQQPAAEKSPPRQARQPAPQPRPAPSPQYVQAAPPVAQAPAICYSCGRVESVQAVQTQAQPSGLGIAAGAVLGGVLGNQVGGGNGRKLATVAGAVGGGFAGNEIEKRTRSNTTYEVRVRMEDGNVRTFPYNNTPPWSVGDRIRVVDGYLTARG